MRLGYNANKIASHLRLTFYTSLTTRNDALKMSRNDG